MMKWYIKGAVRVVYGVGRWSGRYHMRRHLRKRRWY